MNELKIQAKISGVNKVDLAVANDVELFNPQKGMRIMRECNERLGIGYFDFELLQKEGKPFLNVLRTYKGCVGLIIGRRVIFRDIDIVENELKKFKVIEYMFATGNQHLLPLIMSQRMSVVTQKIVHPILSATLQISRGLILYGLIRKVLRKKSGKEWKKIKEQIAHQADSLNVDFNMTLNKQNYALYLERMAKQLEDADISYSLKVLMVLVDNEPQKLSNLAVAVTEIIMGDSVDKLLKEEKSKPIGFVTNHVGFAKDFLDGLLTFRNNEQLGNPVVDYKKKFSPLIINAIIGHDKQMLAQLNVYHNIKTVANIDVDELSKTSAVPKLLEAETSGAVANITEIRPIPGSGSTRLFKDVVTGGKVAYENQIFGHQEIKSDMRFVFVGEVSTEFDAFKSEEIKFDIYQLGNNIPWDYQLEDDWGKYRSVEKILILTFLLMLGLEEMASSGSDCKTVVQSDTDDFLNDCCIKVAFVAGEKHTPDNAVPEKTLNAAIQLYTGKEDGKLSSDYLSRKGYHVLKDKKSAPIYKYYKSLGYDDTDLVSPRSGGNHVMGLKLKSKEDVMAAASRRKIMGKNTRLGDVDFVRFFYDLFEKLLAKYGQQFKKGTMRNSVQ